MGRASYFAKKTKRINANIAMFNKALDSLKKTNPDVRIYAYLAESTYSLVFADVMDPDSTMYKTLKAELHADAFSHLQITGAEQCLSYYYTTDHHWNYRGSYQAYQDIVQLIVPRDYENRYVPTGTKTFDCVFNGSFAKGLKEAVSNEKFTVYIFDDFPCYTSYINGRKKEYTRYKNYMRGKYTKRTFDNHYGLFYGGDYAQVEFRNPDASTKRHLLIIGNSFSNAVKPLLARHFEDIVYIDLRHYEKTMRKTFSLSSCVSQYGITDVLFLSDIKLYALYDNLNMAP